MWERVFPTFRRLVCRCFGLNAYIDYMQVPPKSVVNLSLPPALAFCMAIILPSLLAPSCNHYERPKSFVNSVGMLMVKIPAGYISSLGTKVDEYYLGSTEVTNAQYEMFKPDHHKKRDKYSLGDDHPVVWITWEDALSYTKWLSKREGLPYNLPTEAQWQWAAQAASHHFDYATRNGRLNRELANYIGTGGADRFLFTAPVRSFPPNPLGLYDMSGNVWEYCLDWYHRERTWHRVWIKPRFFPEIRIPFVWYDLPKKWHVLRGGSFVHEEPLLRTTVRNAYNTTTATPSYGFRVALLAKFYRAR